MTGKMKDEIGGVATEEFVGSKPKTFSYFIDDSGEQKTQRTWNKTAVATTSHNYYKDVLLNKKCLRHSENRIQSKYYGLETYEVNKIAFLCFNDKMYNQSNGCDGLPDV